jgi:DNA-binding transcriptional LysR family regulator/DNA-binding Xre family transcriptional regulator
MPNWHKPRPPLGPAAADAAPPRRLQALRLARGLTQAQLARRTNMATSTLSRLESGQRRLAVDHLAPLAAALEVTVGELIGPVTTPGHPEPPDAEPGLDLRRLRYFAALAQDLHFGRAAERLAITQPVLSRQIRKLEQELGVSLLARSSRRVELTRAGRQLAEEAQPLLAAASAAGQRVRLAAAGRASLTIGFFAGDPIIALVRAYQDRHPGTEVDAERIYWSDQPGALLSHHVDVAFAHLPLDQDGLDLAHLYAQPRLVLLPAGHRLAQRSRIAIRELADDPVTPHHGASPSWDAWHNVDPRPDGSRPRRGPAVRNLEEKLEVVGTGRAVSFIPASAAAAIRIPPEVVAVPVVDIPPTRVCLAWKAERRSPAIRALVATALAALRLVCGLIRRLTAVTGVVRPALQGGEHDARHATADGRGPG